MCIYLNRPLDDIPPERVRLEAEAVVTLLPAVEDGQVDWIGSAYLDLEVEQDADSERVRRVTRCSWCGRPSTTSATCSP